MQTFRLLRDNPICENLEILIEEKNPTSAPTMYITGPYLMAGKANRNKRQYSLLEMQNEVKRYNDEFIKGNRALGEICHPENSTEVDLTRACHMVVNLEQKDDNYFIGKSKILSTPSGVIVKQLLTDGIKLGVSSRALGRLQNRGDINMVEGFRLICLDIVHEPSVNSALLDSIMESKQYLIDQGGSIVELACDSLQCKMNALPKKNVEAYLADSFKQFFAALKG